MTRNLLLTTTFFLVTSATFYGDDVTGADANVDTVAETCNAIRKHMDFDYCVSRLRSVPGSASADRHTHFLMATDLAAVSAALAWDTATRMAREESDHPAVRDALETCGYLHWAAAMPALRMYRGYAAARDYWAAGSLSWLVDQVGIGCDKALKGEGGGGEAMSKMVEVNHEFSKLSAMADLILDS